MNVAGRTLPVATCPDCGVERHLSRAQISRINNGLRSGRCLACSRQARTTDPYQRFTKSISVSQESGCWDWIGPRNRAGYGVIYLRNGRSRSWLAHRWIWQHIHGPIGSGLEVDHLCFNRACVNPAHLEPVTPDENKRRWVARVRARTHCKAGHEFSPDNTYIHPSKGTRQCKRCRADGEFIRRRRASL